MASSSGCQDGYFTFTFEAEGQSWQGQQRAWIAGADCDAITAGMRLPVHFRPGNPAEHVATEDPNILVRNEVTALSLLVAASLVGGVLVVRRRR